MRNNGYVSQTNYPIEPDDFLISRTDINGYITYANPRFIEVSGFDIEELMNEPHNVVRHPDMPPEVYRDMWSTLREGLSWQGYVKNRRKNGDHYWVHANVVPVVDRGELQGYASLRSYAGEEKARYFDHLYRQMRENNCPYYLKRGKLKRKGLRGKLPSFQWEGVKARVIGSSIASAALLGGGLWVSQRFGFTGWSLGVLALVLASSIWSVNALLLGSLNRSVASLKDIALQLAAGNLNTVIPSTNRQSLRQTLDALQLMRRSLLSTASDIQRNMEAIGPVVSQILNNNTNMADRLEQQASAVQETAASMEEISSTVRQSASNAQLASKAADTNLAEVGTATRLTDELAHAMDALTKQSERMKHMVQTIDAIAFQTNILALNASVEAARAGEHGRGFAVVAQEVRKLSNQTAEAAKEVQRMIVDTNQSVLESAAHTRETQAATQRIRHASQRVNDLMEEISRAASEQSDGVAQIGLAIAEIDSTTQASASDMESYRRVADTLSGEAASLTNSVNAFRTSQSGAQPLPALRRPQLPGLAKPSTKPLPYKQPAADGWEQF
ncbi:methyl-accepting chemotaxis protein [Vreelandella sp.]|uniref:methyl-accepting chemotaxis protein n=1 Tax=Vreelandella sp. TaxID=3137778 RepID=UPI003BAB7139